MHIRCVSSFQIDVLILPGAGQELQSDASLRQTGSGDTVAEAMGGALRSGTGFAEGLQQAAARIDTNELMVTSGFLRDDRLLSFVLPAQLPPSFSANQESPVLLHPGPRAHVSRSP